MSLPTFSRFFRKASGSSVTHFVNRIRTNKACPLLMHTAHYVTNVCYNIGCNNDAQFQPPLPATDGVTPKECRRKAEGRCDGEPPTSEE